MIIISITIHNLRKVCVVDDIEPENANHFVSAVANSLNFVVIFVVNPRERFIISLFFLILTSHAEKNEQ